MKIALYFLLLAAFAPVLAADETPKGTLIEAETELAQGDLQVLADQSASGGKAVTMQREWQTLLRAPLPQNDTNAFQIWVNYKAGPLLLKADLAGGQKDLHWLWDAPNDFQWKDAGTYSRADLGRGLVIIRGGLDQKAPVLDAIVLAPATVKTLPPFEPNNALPALTIEARVNWNKVLGEMKPQLWGINDYEVLDPQKAADTQFQTLLGEFHAPLIRIHNGGIVDAWTNAQTRSWDVEKIRAGLAASTGYGDAKIMLNLARCPGWLSTKAVLTPDEEDQFAALLGDLARLMRDDIKRRIDYWELTNEFDSVYERNNQLPALWRVFNKCAAAVKKADPTAKIGGPAFSWPKPEWLEGFFRNCAQNVDFFTWHNYASGDIYDDNATVLSKAAHIADMARDVTSAAQKYAPDRKLEFFLSELNIKWVWTPVERRHGNNIGALFLASTLHHLAATPIDGVTMWHVKGGSYGLINGDNTLRATGQLYQWSSKYLHGQLVEANSSDEDALEVIALQRADNQKTLLLLNKAERSVTLPNALQVLAGQKWDTQRIDATGTTSGFQVPEKGVWTLPGYSLTLLSSD